MTIKTLGRNTAAGTILRFFFKAGGFMDNFSHQKISESWCRFANAAARDAVGTYLLVTLLNCWENVSSQYILDCSKIISIPCLFQGFKMTLQPVMCRVANNANIMYHTPSALPVKLITNLHIQSSNCHTIFTFGAILYNRVVMRLNDFPCTYIIIQHWQSAKISQFLRLNGPELLKEIFPLMSVCVNLHILPETLVKLNS